MQDKKQKKAKIQVIFLILISTLVILADFYAIINYPKEYMLIAAITVIFMICLWGVISGFFSLSALKEDRREEQYVVFCKSPVVDLNNTNRNLTPDEIAALFSSM